MPGDNKGRTTAVLLTIVGVALILRVVGVWHGLPFPLRSDEESLIGGALRMLELRSVIPALHPHEMAILNYPPLLPYIYLLLFVPYLGVLYVASGVPAMTEFSLTAFDHMGALFLLARLTSVTFSLMTVIVVWRLGCEMLKSRTVGLAAAALMAVDFVSVFTGHFARHWSLTTLIVWATVLIAWRIYQRQRLKDYILLGLLAGLGFGVSYSFGSIGIVAGAIAHISARGIRRVVDRDMVLAGVVFLLTAAVFFALNPQAVLRLVVGGVAGLDEPKSFAGWIDAVRYYSVAFWYANPALVIVSAVGLLAALRRRRFAVAAGGIGAWLFVVTLLYVTVSLEGRYIVLIVPILALLGGVGIADALDRRWSGRFVQATVGVAVVGCVAFPFVVAANASWMLARPDTRQLALEWIHDHIPTGSRIVANLNGVSLRSTRTALVEQQKVDPDSLTAFERARLRVPEPPSPGANHPSAYHVLNLSRFTGEAFDAAHAAARLDAYREQGYDYFVGQYLDQTDLTPLYEVVRKKGRLVARFVATGGSLQPPYLRSTVLLAYPIYHLLGMERFGPTVEIYATAKPQTHGQASP